MERLRTVIFNVTTIRDILSGSADPILVQYKELVDELLMHLQQVNAFLNGSLDHSLAESVAYRASVIRTHQRGRPRFAVTIDQLKYLRSLSFSWIRISRMLGISRMTLYRRRQQFNMLHDHGGITIQYQELVEILQQMRAEHPYLGEVMVLGRLRSLGYAVCRRQLRLAIQETDPINTALRATTGPLSRRVYSVPGPNSLWHIGKFVCLKSK